MLTTRTDKELVAFLKAGSQDAFEEIINRYSKRVFSVAMRFVGASEDAEEVLQDVFVAVFKKIGEFEEKSALSSWIYRVAINSSLMKLRQRRRRHEQMHVEDIPREHVERFFSALTMTPDLDGSIDNAALRVALEAAIGRLPGEFRTVYLLREVQGLSSRQVCKLLRLSLPTVKSRVHRSRLMLRRRLLPLYREYVSAA